MADPTFTGNNISPIRPNMRSDAPLGGNLKSGGGDGTSGGMEALIDAKVAAAEARTDTKFAAVLAKLDGLASDNRRTSDEIRMVRGSIWTAAFAIMGLILAVVGILVTVAPSSFSAGAQVRDIARDEVRASQAVVKPIPAPVPEARAAAKP